MTDDNRLLQRVLRFQLDATHQQFFHILALRQWREKDAVARITEVDNVDFPGAMRIIDYLVSRQAPITLPAPGFTPGQDYATILWAERELEKRFDKIGTRNRATASGVQNLLDAAAAPRRSYARWLDEQIETGSATQCEQPEIASALQDLVAHLVTMVEQSMIHAFVEWHAADRPAADAAWATSGAAMMQLTRLVALFATLPAIPVPGVCPAPEISRVGGNTLAADQALALDCERQARSAAGRCGEEATGACCAGMADYYRALANWTPSRKHPAAATNPPCFHSFANTRQRFVVQGQN